MGWTSWTKGVVSSALGGGKEKSSAEPPKGDEVVNPEETDGEQGHASRANEEERKHLWKQLAQYVGSDVMSLLSIPVWLMEPLSTLQKMSEITEFMHCLAKADDSDDESVRCAMVAAFACGAYASIKRTYKPFNPILGETFEVALPDGAVYLAEQVSHHPPIAAAHCESDKYTYDIVSCPKTKFYGNSIDVFPYGITRIQLKKSGDIYALVPPITRANNLLLGMTWVDTFGDLLVVNLTKGNYAALHFHQCGWFGGGRHKVAGTVYSADGEPKLAVCGKWNEQMSYMACDAEGAAVKGMGETEVWRHAGSIKGDAYAMSSYARWLQTMASAPQKGKGMLSTDSRIRPDVVALNSENNGEAASAKHMLEEKQRAEKKTRVGRNEVWTPRWFKATERLADADVYEDVKEFEEDVVPWKFTGSYVEHRKTLSADCAIPVEFAPWQY